MLTQRRLFYCTGITTDQGWTSLVLHCYPEIASNLCKGGWKGDQTSLFIIVVAFSAVNLNPSSKARTFCPDILNMIELVV